MLSARDLTLRRGPEPLFEQVNFTVFRGDKVGLIGANGTGKSSLFADSKTPRPLLTVEDATCGYSGRKLVSRVNLSIGAQVGTAIEEAEAQSAYGE